mgnify:FL=1
MKKKGENEMKKNFDDTTQTLAMFGSIEEAQEEPKKADTSTKEPEEAQNIKEEKNEPKKAQKMPSEDKKKCNLFSEVNQSVYEYIELKTKVTGESKKDILNKIFGDEIKRTFELSENATEEEMQRAIERKMKQIEQMKSLFK